MLNCEPNWAQVAVQAEKTDSRAKPWLKPTTEPEPDAPIKTDQDGDGGSDSSSQPGPQPPEPPPATW